MIQTPDKSAAASSRVCTTPTGTGELMIPRFLKITSRSIEEGEEESEQERRTKLYTNDYLVIKIKLVVLP